jgi:hypothetical protein
MIQCLMKVLAQQAYVLGFVQLAGANGWASNRVGRNEVANRSLVTAAVEAVGEWKVHLAFQAQRLFHGLSYAAAIG